MMQSSSGDGAPSGANKLLSHFIFAVGTSEGALRVGLASGFRLQCGEFSKDYTLKALQEIVWMMLCRM